MIYGRTPFEAVACGCKRIILIDIEIFHETFDGNATFLPLGNEEAARKELQKSVYVMVNDDFPYLLMLWRKESDSYLIKI